MLPLAMFSVYADRCMHLLSCRKGSDTFPRMLSTLNMLIDTIGDIYRDNMIPMKVLHTGGQGKRSRERSIYYIGLRHDETNCLCIVLILGHQNAF